MANKGKRKYTPQQLSIIRKNYAARDQPTAKTREAAKSEKESFPHFRIYLKSRHPALVLQEHSEDEYSYRKVMHSEKDGRHVNEKVFPNPKKGDPNPMYIGTRVRHDKKKFFGPKLSWKYPKK